MAICALLGYDFIDHSLLWVNVSKQTDIYVKSFVNRSKDVVCYSYVDFS